MKSNYQWKAMGDENVLRFDATPTDLDPKSMEPDGEEIVKSKLTSLVKKKDSGKWALEQTRLTEKEIDVFTFKKLAL